MPALGAGGGQGGIGGNPGAIEAAAEQVRGGAAAIGEAGTSVAGRGDAVVARWQGSASDASHERIRFLADRTDVGADALSGLPKVLADYAQALREAQARYAAGQLAAGVAAMNQASATTAIAAVEAETTSGAVPGNDPGHVGRQRQAGAALDAAVEAGQVAAADMAGAVAAEKAANDVAAGQVNAIAGLMAGMSARTPGPSPAAADWADGYRGKLAAPQAKAAGAIGPGVTAPGVLGPGATPEALAAAGLAGGAAMGPFVSPLQRQFNVASTPMLPTAYATREASGLPPKGVMTPEALQERREASAREEAALHVGLDALGMFPVVGAPADLMNAGIYAADGDWANAGFSAVAAIPVIGEATTAVRYVIKAKRAADALQGAGEVLEGEQDTPKTKAERVAYFNDLAEKQAGPATVAPRYTSPAPLKPPGAKFGDTLGADPRWDESPKLDDNGETKRPRNGPLWVHPSKNPTAAQIAEAQEYADLSQEAWENGGFNPAGRVSTEGELRQAADVAARDERDLADKAATTAETAAKEAGEDPAQVEEKRYQGQPGHVPDTTWGGKPEPYKWLDLSQRTNGSIGQQAQAYPYGYQVEPLPGDERAVIGPLDPEYIAMFGEWK